MFQRSLNIAALLLLFALSLQAQQPQFSWAKRDGNITYNINPTFPRQVVAAHNGKALWGVIQNNRGSINQAMQGDYKLSEMDASGNVLTSTTLTGKISLTDAQADAAGNWYILGRYSDTVRCANNLMLVRGINGPQSAYFLLRLHAGTLAADWIQPVGGSTQCATECFAVTPNGIYLPVDSSLSSSVNRFELATGARTKLWDQAGRSNISSISVDAQDNVYLMGTCVLNGGISFNGTSSTPPASLDYPWYVVRYKAGGQHHWHYWLNDISCFERSLKLAGPNAVYIAGELSDSATLAGYHFAKPGGLFGTDYLLARLDSNGALVWAQQRYTGTTPGTPLSRIYFESTNQLAIADTTLFLFPVTQGNVHWNASISTATQTANNNIRRNSTVVAFNSAGTAKWGAVVKGNYTLSQHIITDGNAIWITGVGNDSTALVFDTVSLSVPQMQYVPYLAKMTLTSAPTGVKVSYQDAAFRIWPNPAHDAILIDATGPAEIRVLDITGRLLISEKASGRGVHRINVSKLPRAAYFIEVSNNSGRSVQQIVLK